MLLLAPYNRVKTQEVKLCERKDDLECAEENTQLQVSSTAGKVRLIVSLKSQSYPSNGQ